jgi:hypothetical protein
MSNLPDIHDHVQQVEIEKCDLTCNGEWEDEINKMLVIFFEMRILFSHPKIETIFIDFGHNIPKYVQYEGGSNDGMTVVCCVDISVDAKSICLPNGVRYTKLREIEIDKTMYNNSHRVYNG